MAEPMFRLSLNENQIIIESCSTLDTLTIEQRIFLMNILGFELIGGGVPTYSINTDSKISELFLEVMGYFNAQQISISLDEKAKKFDIQIKDNHIKLEKSFNEGVQLKKNPITDVKIPGLERPLKSYQIPAVSHLLHVDGAANFSVPGSGKTSIVLSAYAVLKSKSEIDKLVVIGPRSSFRPWEEEFFSCFKIQPKCLRIVGSKNARNNLFNQANQNDLILLTYQMAANEVLELTKFMQKHKIMLVLDESHNIKRLEGGTWAEAIITLAPYAKRRIILSGTPVPNSLYDLWSQTTFLWPQEPLLGSRESFKYRVDKYGEKLVPELQDTLSPFYWRIHKHDLGLPQPQFHRIKFRMNPYQKTIYDTIATKILSDLIKIPEERIALRIWRKARLVRLLQAASNPTLLTKYSKEFRIPPLNGSDLPVSELIEHYSEYETPVKILEVTKLTRELVKKNQKVLIWTSFIHNILTLQKLLIDLNPGVIYGDIPKDDNEDEQFNREKIIHNFKTSPRNIVLIANPSACAESVSLHKICKNAIYLDRTFNGAHYLQSLDRIHRVGLEENDEIHYWIPICADSIDEVIDERLKEKQKKLLELMDDEFGIIDLESSEGEFSEESEEEKDFISVINQIKAKSQSPKND